MKLTVTNVDRVMQSSGPHWMVKYTVQREKGEELLFGHRISPEHDVFLHLFPEERISTLVGEYNLDPTDMDEVMDLLLSEPFVDESDGEPTLYSGAEPEVVKEAHLRRCAKAKLAIKLSTRGVQNPVEMVRSAPLNSDLVERSRLRVIETKKAVVRTTLREARRG